MRALVAFGLAVSLLSAPALAADKKGPPACAAIDFRPIAQGMPDGEHEAGIYKSRFGKIEVSGTVKGGEAKDYSVTVNGKPLKPVAAPAKSADDCAKVKKVPTPTKAADACTGSKLRVVIDSSGKDKLLLLYSLKGKSWSYCRAATV